MIKESQPTHTPTPCTCKEPEDKMVVHRQDGPCYISQTTVYGTEWTTGGNFPNKKYYHALRDEQDTRRNICIQ